ncbi:MAG: ArsR/SmtB family transcription factor [Promethearchaeota archaeon]
MKQERKLEIIDSLKMCVDLKNEDLMDYFEQLHQKGKELDKNKILKELAEFFNILGNDTRLKIIKILNQKDFCVCELEAILDKSQSSISHHLKLLEKSGLIRGIKRGYFTHYELIRENFKELLNFINEQLSLI